MSNPSEKSIHIAAQCCCDTTLALARELAERYDALIKQAEAMADELLDCKCHLTIQRERYDMYTSLEDDVQNALSSWQAFKGEL